MGAQPIEDRELGYRTLAWVYFSPVPLSMQQLQYAMLIRDDISSIDEDMTDTPEYILTKCAGLVRIDRVSRTVRFVHGTVLDYISRNVQRLNHSIDLLARTGLTYLLSDNFLEDSCSIPPLKGLDKMYTDKDEGRPARSVASKQMMSTANAAIFSFRDRHPFATYTIDNLTSLVKDSHSASTLEELRTLFKDSARLWKYHDTLRWFSFCLYPGVPVPVTRSPLLFAIDLDLPGIVSWVLGHKLQGEQEKTDPGNGITEILGPRIDHTKHHYTGRAQQTASEQILGPCTALDFALHFAVYRGRTNTISHLLRIGADADALSVRFPITMLRYGSGISDPLNDKDAKVWYNSLSYGIAGHQHAAVKLLLDAGANVDAGYMSNPCVKHPLWLAIEQEDTAMIKALTAGGADIDRRSFQGDTPLHYAVKRSSDVCVIELLALGASVHAVNNENESALFLAIIDDKANIVASLVRHGARPKTLLKYSAAQLKQAERIRPVLLQTNEEELDALFQRYSETTITLDCGYILSLFRELVEAAIKYKPEADPDDRFAEIDHQLSRFLLWTRHIGVFAKEKYSLDYRLRRRLHLQQRIRAQLKDLEAVIHQGM
jgi:hypothetical protein